MKTRTRAALLALVAALATGWTGSSWARDKSEGDGDRQAKEAPAKGAPAKADASDGDAQPAKAEVGKKANAGRDEDDGAAKKNGRKDADKKEPGKKDARSDADEDDADDLPPAVRKTAQRLAPGLKVEHVRHRDVKNQGTVYIIDGESEDRDVTLTIEEDGDILDARFRKHPEGAKPQKATLGREDLPPAVLKTAERVVPKLKIDDVRSREVDQEGKLFTIVGTTTADSEPRAVMLTIEEDGDLHGARIYKPKKDSGD